MGAGKPANVSVSVREADFDTGAEIAALRAGDPRIGAVACFVGLVRDINDGAGVSEMTLEHYPGMTEKALEAIVAEALTRWDVYGVRVIHRVGRLLPTDQIVLMDYLKTRAPFWKREVTPDGARWVDARETDDSAAERWQR
jgi:molybdopterin synthase catalytic subunit